ncbi:Na-translocating system protein MpsB [Isoptericola sp. b441]|uniref:Probable inorganic carbon transporter subunit DabA n=1 Tax=Actinotalea lenta TaxID=3064654 RepID=A0ABT9D4W7_9CELL|nr:putative inorganic carbon transporter subunit DabA [Isoptericola sp. b441]MDO8105767.1 Na-translocating system protein MpsB [Isoptericola sp. b441]
MFALSVARIPPVALLLAALVALGRSLSGTTPALVLGRMDLGPLGTADVAWTVGPVEAALLALVAGIGTVVTSYSARNLVGQRRLVRYAALETAAVAGLALAVTASSLPVLAAGWTLGTFALTGLVSHAGTTQARRAARQVRARLLVGDALLWAAVLLAGTQLGTLDRADLSARVAQAPSSVVTLTALAVVGAGMVRSALVPAHRWLPETAEAPSPVSALLHAGLVNGVGVLALLLWPLVEAATAARVLLLLAGATTAVVATAQLRTRADVKGRLAASTSSQMGYLAIQAGLGIPAGVLAHVIGHGVWKASLFLGAGGAVGRARTRDAAGSGHRRLPVVLGAVVAATVGLSALAPAAWLPALTAPAELLVLVIATVAAWVALDAVARRDAPLPARLLASGLVLAAVAGYLLGLRALGHLLADVVGEPAPWTGPQGPVTAGAVLVLVVTGVVAARIDGAARAGRRPRLARRAARSSLRPTTLRGRFAGAPSVAMPIPPVTEADATAARHDLDGASSVAGVLFPLTSFVASNPLAGLEDLDVVEATRVAGDTWGAEPGPSARALRDAQERGRLQEADLAAALEAGSVEVGVRPDLLRALLVSDGPGAHELAWAVDALDRAGVEPDRALRTPVQVLLPHAPEVAGRARDLANHCCARSLAGTAWPGAAGPWQELRALDLDALIGVRGAADVVAALPADATGAIAALLEHLGVHPQDRPALLARVVARDPGWPAHLQWRARHERLGREAGLDLPTQGAADALLAELVATRLALDVVVAEAHAPRLLGRPFDPSDLVHDSHDRLAGHLSTLRHAGLLGADPGPAEVRAVAGELADLTAARLASMRAEALERAFRRTLLGPVAARAEQPAAAPGSAQPPAAQLVTCIDVRSERLRRHLEALGPWETLGAAGFFGLPVQHSGPTGTVTERTPALVRPGAAVTERRGPTRGLAGCDDALVAAARAVEGAVGLPFGWAEAAGWFYAPFVLLTTLAPAGARALREVVRRALGTPRRGTLDVVSDVGVDTLADAAAGFLATLGNPDLAPLVVIAGHGGGVTNNPHVAAYDCGACGGAAGDVNARVMVQALNDPRVRRALGERGVTLTPQTRFVAAVHDTTRDVVAVLDREELPDQWSSTLGDLEADLSRAGHAVRHERLALLPEGAHRNGLGQVRRRAADWAQPRPEWGLAGAAAIVVGPRDLTRGLALDGRVFLQSYRAGSDPDGVVLEQLLAAPVVVAQWITAQYWASTVDPHRFGAGDKTTHNVVGDGPLSAVVTGARGDLRLGLPWQAVSATSPVANPSTGQDPWTAATHHEALRLLVVVAAERSTVDRAVQRQPAVARLVSGGWITVAVVEPGSGETWVMRRDGSWVAEALPLGEGTVRETVRDA